MTALRCLHRVEDWIAGGFIAVVVASVSLQVFCRYVLNNALPWPEELAKLCFVWGIFFGAAIGVRRRGHISVEALIATFPTRLRLAVRTFTYAAVIVILGILVAKGIDMTRLSMTSKLPAINVPLGFLYLPLPICSALMIIDFAGLLIDAARRFARGDDGPLTAEQ